jgi:hypothetical protein
MHGVENRIYRRDVNTLVHDVLTTSRILIDKNNNGAPRRCPQHVNGVVQNMFFLNLFSRSLGRILHSDVLFFRTGFFFNVEPDS